MNEMALSSDRQQEQPLELSNLVSALTDELLAHPALTDDEILSRYPAHAAQLRDLLPTLRAIASLPSSSAAMNGDGRARVALSMHEEQRLGDFRILRELGRGGMGTVYEAEQVSMGRRVALKVLPFAALAQDKALQRFRNEVRAAAALDHPHIISVYSVGEERGIHYYSMQLVRGQSLAEMIAARQQRSEVGGQRLEAGAHGDLATVDRRPQSPIPNPQSSLDTRTDAALATVPESNTQQYFRSIARLGVQAAEALQHAHEQGVLHRDIKPGNLLLDANGVLYITDFGLARLEADAGMTMTGDILGTLRYMAPEQVRGERVVIDQRADVYSLGATLYELLTLQAAFGETDRTELLRRIATEEPRSLRKIDRHIPVELETIVLKAMEKDATDRYLTAQDLADDLQAYLDDRPIKAKPLTLLQRSGKWSRRHSTAVKTIAACGLVASVLATWLVSRHVYAQRAVIAAVESSLLQANAALASDEVDLAEQAVGQAELQALQLGEADSSLRRRIEELNHELERYEKYASLYRKARRHRANQPETREPIYEALNIYGVMNDDDWLAPLRESGLPQAHLERVAEQAYEMLILLAHDKILWTFQGDETYSEAEKLARITETEHFLEKAKKLRKPTKGYYWVLATCSQRLGDLTEGAVRAHHDHEALRLRALAEKTPPQNAAELFYISRDRYFGCAAGEREPFNDPIETRSGVFAAYREMLRIEPDYYNALFFAGFRYVNTSLEKNYQAAIEALNGCLALDPDDVTAVINRSQCLRELGLLEESLVDAIKARRMMEVIEKPDKTKAHLLGVFDDLASDLQDSGKIESARVACKEQLAIYDALLTTNPDGIDDYAKQRAEVSQQLEELEKESTLDE